MIAHGRRLAWRRSARVVAALGLFVAASFGAPGRDEFTQAKVKLGSSDGRERRAAVTELGRIASPEAWKLVVAALSDPDSQVADEAQLQIARIEDAGSRKLLLGKDGLQSRSALVRERVVESLARWGARPRTEVLAPTFSDRDARVRRAAAWSVERLARAGRFAKAWEDDLIEMSTLEAALAAQLAKEKEPESFAALAVARQALLGTPQRKDLEALVSHPSWPARAGAAWVLSTARDPDGLPQLAALSRDTAVGVRINCARALAASATKDAAVELVGMLERESELRPKWLYVEHLRGLSGLQHRLDPRPWRAWVEALPEGPVERPKSTSPARGAAAEPASSAFAGLPILSERLAFLIDLSGSMWEKRADGRTRKQLVDEELTRALRSLSPETRFNVVVYTSRPVAWKERLTPASPKAVQEALDFFVKRSDSGKGDFWGALEFTLADGDIDTVIVLTDGAPSGGERWSMELIKDLFVERFRFRGLVLDAVLADSSRRLREHWTEMAGRSGGRVVEIELK